MKRFFKENTGFVASDALMAILIITLFTGIIVTLTYNIYISNTSLKRMSTANLYIVNVFEYIDEIEYSDLDDTDEMINKFDYLDDIDAGDLDEPDDNNLERLWGLEGSTQNGYQIIIYLDKYVPTHQEHEEVFDLVRQITITVQYKVGNRDQEITMTRVKTK